MNTITARTVKSLIIKIESFIPQTGRQCRTNLEQYVKFLKCTPYALNGRIGNKKEMDYWRLMKDLLNYIEIEGIDGPFYGLKTMTERVMSYF